MESFRVEIGSLRTGKVTSVWEVVLKPDVALNTELGSKVTQFCSDLDKGKNRKRKPSGVALITRIS
jgi:hypothetical protein